MKRTKIIATLGPATEKEEILSQCLEAGVNLVRLNFSHGKAEDHIQRAQTVRSAAKKLGKIVGILADLQGPKIRIACFKEKSIELQIGDTFKVDPNHPSDAGDQHIVGLDYAGLVNDVQVGDRLLLDDGRVILKINDITGTTITTTVEMGGTLSNHKGINREGGGLSAEALPAKDLEDLQHIAKMDVDYVAISFVRCAEDIQILRGHLESLNCHAGIVAKIERKEALDHLDEIIEAADAVMVARGDLAVEIGDASVPGAQKRMIKRARWLNKPVIVATQMMESMVSNSIPTRAEISDVANAVLDGSDAVMLSAETAVGRYPVACVKAMARACMVAELESRTQVSHHRADSYFTRTDEAIAMAAMYTANHLDIAAVISLTESGYTALLMSRIRTGIPIYALTSKPKTLGRVTLYRDVYPIVFDVSQFPEESINPEAIRAVSKLNKLDDDDRVLITRGEHLGVLGGTNSLKILPVGDLA